VVEFAPGVTPAIGWTVLAVGAMLFGLTKTGIPGISILAVVLMASVMDPKQSVGLVLPLLITGDIFTVIYYRRHAVWRHLLRLMPSALVGIGIGFALLGQLEGADLGPIVGGIVLLLLAVELGRSLRQSERIPSHWSVAAGIGLLAGITTMFANAAGPLLVIYFTAMRFDKHKFIGTAAWYFLTLNCIKVPLFWHHDMITAESLRTDLCLVPAVLTGAVLGVVVLKRIPQRAFVVVVKVLAAAGATKLIVW